MLTALSAALCRHARWNMRVPHAGFRLILMLSARPATPESIALEVVWLDLDVDRALDIGRDINGCERSVPALVGVERADAHQAMHAGLALQVAVGVIAAD